MAARRRRGRSSFRRKKENVEWANNSIVTPVLFTAANQLAELIPDAMSGLVLAPDFLVKRIVGRFNVTPQAAATATSTIGLAIYRSVHAPTGAPTTAVNPLDTDIDAGSQDIMWQWQGQPEYGGALDATALDLSFGIAIDLKAKASIRKLDKRHGIQLVWRAETTARVEMTFRLRILGALARA